MIRWNLSLLTLIISNLFEGTVKFKTWNIYTDSGDKTDTEKVPELVLEDVIIGAIPIEIISHETPLSFAEHRYTIKFFSHTGKIFTIGPKTLEEILLSLHEP